MKIAFTSDIHVDVNKDYDITRNIINYLKAYGCCTLIVAGDISSNYNTTLGVIEKFKRGGIKVYFVPGNHDIYTNNTVVDSYETYRRFCSKDGCLSGETIKIGSSVIVGDMGWYDYSFGDYLKYNRETIEKKIGWDDTYRITFNDIEFCKYQNKKFKSRLDLVVEEYGKDQRIIVVSHMVPCIELCRQYPDTYFDAFTGNQELWNIVKEYNVDTWLYGHNHINRVREIDGIKTVSSGLNYHGKWNGRDVSEQIEYAITFLEV